MNVALIFEFDSKARVCWEVDHYGTYNLLLVMYSVPA